MTNYSVWTAPWRYSVICLLLCYGCALAISLFALPRNREVTVGPSERENERTSAAPPYSKYEGPVRTADSAPRKVPLDSPPPDEVSKCMSAAGKMRQQSVATLERDRFGALTNVAPCRRINGDAALWVLREKEELVIYDLLFPQPHIYAVVGADGRFRYTDEAAGKLPASPRAWPYRDAKGRLDVPPGAVAYNVQLDATWEPTPPPGTVAWYRERDDGVLVQGCSDERPFPNVIWLVENGGLRFFEGGPIVTGPLADIERSGWITLYDPRTGAVAERFFCKTALRHRGEGHWLEFRSAVVSPFCDALLPSPPPPG